MSWTTSLAIKDPLAMSIPNDLEVTDDFSESVTLAMSLIHYNLGIRRKWWYHKNDERAQRYPIDKSLLNKFVQVSRFVVNSGYYYDYSSLPDSGNLAKYVDLLVFSQLQHIVPESIDDRHGIKQILDELEKQFGMGVRRSALYRARMVWATALYEKYHPEYKNLRTAWYVNVNDVNQQETIWLQIKGWHRHMFGIRYSASGWTGSFSGEYDYEPGGLNDGYHQTLYHAYGVCARNFNDWCECAVEIHPLDILDVKDERKE